MKKLKQIALLVFIIFFQTAAYAEFHHVDSCYVCHDMSKLTDWGYVKGPDDNEKYINNIIQTPNSGDREVVFKDRDYSDDNFTDYADGDTLFNGVCEVCHTVNNHHRNDGSDETAHFDGQRCTACHLHSNEFAPPVEQAHRTHLDYRGKGPLITECTVCHTAPIDVDPNYQFSNSTPFSPVFRDGNTLATTTACDNCHSPWGAYPGGDETTSLMESTIGAKANFRTGIYESDGYTLKAGKEKWCVTCHDDRPSTSQYDADPDNVVTPFSVSYADANVTYSTEGSWGERKWASTIGHMRSHGANVYGSAWAEYDFEIPQDGNYAVNMRWNVDGSSCNDTASKAAIVSITDINGTVSKSYNQPGTSSDEYSLVGTFDMVAGPVTFKLAKDPPVGCTLIAGHIQLVLQAGSGGNIVIAPMIAGDDKTWGFYATGHGVSGVQCTECHDTSKKHIDYERRTHSMSDGKSWGDGYRLQSKDPRAGASICARCHDMELIWEGGSGGKVTQTNYRSGSTTFNFHAYHLAPAGMNRADSDWNGVVDSDLSCINCHNVHGSTKPHMFRDGNLVSSPYTSDKKPMYPVGFEVFVKATWKPVLQGGSYEVFARWPAVAGAATNAPFTIKSSEIFSTTVNVDQTANADTWISLGNYTFADDNSSYVILNDKDTDGTVVADAVKFVSAGETVTVDNGDADYSTLDVDSNLSGATGYLGDYDAIETGRTVAVDTANDNNGHATVDFNKPLLVEQRNILMGAPGVDIGSAIDDNGICRSCHSVDDENKAGSNKDIIHFTGPKILSRFEAQRWVLNDGSEDAEVYITARDYDSNISSVTLDLTPIGGGVVAMNPVGQQTYHYTIDRTMINGLPDISYKLPVTATDTDGQVVTDETYLFPKIGADTIYMDTNNVELYNLSYFRFGINSDGKSFQNDLPDDIIYFGPGYRFSMVEAEYANMYGIWRPEIPTSGKYEVYGFWDDLTGSTVGLGPTLLTSGDVNYTAYAADGTFEEIKDQSTGGGGWNYIGTFSFLDDESNYVRQAAVGDHTMIADAMKFVRVNSDPLARLSASQLNKKTRIISTTDRVILSVVATDYDAADTIATVTYDWSANDAEILNTAVIQGNYDDKLNFDPALLSVGFHEVQVTVTDTSAASTTVKLGLQVLAAYPILDAVDTDGDGINDDVEGFSDFDEDGIPNYLDDNNNFNEVPAGLLDIVTEEGLNIRIGSTALAADSNDSVITTAELNTSATGGENGLFDGDVNVGGLFDFDIVGLDAVGQSVKVVLPLQDDVTIPAGATYQKFDANTGWQLFVIDANNAVHSALSVAGVCPTPGSASYITGLNAGDDCIQLTIKDGGPNDADGIANAEVKDPGGIFGAPVVEAAGGEAAGGGGGGSFSIWTLLVLGLFGIIGAIASRKQ